MKKLSFLIGFRKFTMGLIFFSTSLILLYFNVVTGSEWIQHNASVVTAFFATNVGEHLLKLGEQYFKDKVVDRVLNNDKNPS